MTQDLTLSQVTLSNKAIKESIEPIEMGFANLETACISKFITQKTMLNAQAGKIKEYKNLVRGFLGTHDAH